MNAYLLSIGTIGGIYILLALSLVLQWGRTGLINFGLVAFFCIGAYASALITGMGAPIAVGLGAGTVLAALAAWPLGRLTLKLRADYLALVAVGFGEVIRVFCENEVWLTNGPTGLAGLAQFFPEVADSERPLLIGILVFFSIICIYYLLRLFFHAPYGRVLLAIRDNESAALALGKPNVSYKTQALVVGSAIAGYAGGLYAHYFTYIAPEMFSPDVTFNVWIAVVIGGSASSLGAIFGTILLIIFLEGTRFLNDFGLTLSGSQLGALRFILIGIGLIICLRWRPAGLVSSPH